jgi:hypothetical protein
MSPSSALGLASDFTLIGNTAPRFGDFACAGYLGAGASSGSGAQLLETLVDAEQYRFDDQRDAVAYAWGARTCAPGPRLERPIACGHNAPLEPYVMGDRLYDYNVDGLAHYGMVPDLLQDVANVLGDNTHYALDPVFRAAEGYIETWERARALAACEGEGGHCRTAPYPDDLQCTGARMRYTCGAACPCAWNHGAPLQELAQRDDVCDTGKTIHFPIVDAAGHPRDADPVYQQRGADPLQAGDLTAQGDWAIFPIRTPQQTWACGGGARQLLRCPAAANYVKVRRVLDTTVSPFTSKCTDLPLPPETGNRRVIFQCLAGPPADAPPEGRR